MSAVENPPAFPQRQFDSFGHGEDQAGPEGMTLRDYFAGQAIGTIIKVCAGDSREKGQSAEQMFAQRAYAIADAMLAARQEQAA